MIKLFLHVGFPKTASSTFQKHLYSRHPGLFYVGRPFSDSMAAIESDILTLDSARFEQGLPEHQKRFRQEIAGADDRPILISHEGFLRNTRYSGHDLWTTAERIHRVFADALGDDAETNVIILIRNQADLLLSHFVQFMKGSQKDLDELVTASLRDPGSGFFSSLFYCELFDHYSKLFGKEHLKILVFEEFVRDSAAFVFQLSDILGIDSAQSIGLLDDKHEKEKIRQKDSYLVPHRRSRDYRLAKVMRRIGLVRLAREAEQRSVTPIELSKEQRQQIDDLFRATNIALQESYGLRLAGFGYPV